MAIRSRVCVEWFICDISMARKIYTCICHFVNICMHMCMYIIINIYSKTKSARTEGAEAFLCVCVHAFLMETPCNEKGVQSE